MNIYFKQFPLAYSKPNFQPTFLYPYTKTSREYRHDTNIAYTYVSVYAMYLMWSF